MLMNYSGSMVDVFTSHHPDLRPLAYLVMYLFCSLAAFKLALRGDLGVQGRRLAWLLAVAMLGALYSLWTLWGAAAFPVEKGGVGVEAFWWGMGLFALGLPSVLRAEVVAATRRSHRRRHVPDLSLLLHAPLSCNAIRATTSCSSPSASAR